MIEGDTGGVAVPPFDYKEIKRRFGGIVIANNGFDKERATRQSKRAAQTSSPSASRSSQTPTS